MSLESHAALREGAFGWGHYRTRENLQRRIAFYEGWGKPEKAAEYRAMMNRLDLASSVSRKAG